MEAMSTVGSVGRRRRALFAVGLLLAVLAIVTLVAVPNRSSLATAALWSDAQVESSPSDAAVLIDRLPWRIDRPGRYRLARNLVFPAADGAAVTIASDGVSIDLAGKSIKGTAGSSTAAIGIAAIDCSGISIRNGTIAGFYFGIDIGQTGRGENDSRGHVLSNLELKHNWYFGVRLVGSHSEIRNCTIADTGGSTKRDHTIPHGARLVGEANAMRGCCIRDLRLKRFDDGRGEIVAVHFNEAKNCVLEDNRFVEVQNEHDDSFSSDNRRERRFGLWVNSGSDDVTYLTVKNNVFSGFTVPAAFTPSSNGTVEGNTFAGAGPLPIRGKPASQLDKNTIVESTDTSCAPRE